MGLEGFFYLIQQSTPPVPILSQFDPAHTPHLTPWRSILILSSNLCLGLPSGLFHSGVPTKPLHSSPPYPKRNTCHAYIILLDLIRRTLFGEECRSLSSSLCSLFNSPLTSSLLGPNTLLNTQFSKVSLRSSTQGERQSFTPIQKNKQNYSSVYFHL